MSDEYSPLRADLRKRLLHEGNDEKVVSAYVELIFDNSDHRVPIDAKMIKLKRTLGEKKDQYFFNNKTSSRTEVMNLLKSGGLSSSSSFYIVQQGMINQLTTATDKERLKLLREVAGTTQYYEQFPVAQNLLMECDVIIKQVTGLVDDLNVRYENYSREDRELQNYEKCNRMCKTLEQLIYERELTTLNWRMQRVENSRLKCKNELQSHDNTAKHAHKNIELTTRAMKELKEKLIVLMGQKDLTYNQFQRFAKAKAGLKFEKRDLEQRNRTDAERAKQIEGDLSNVKDLISKTEKKLEKMITEYTEAKTKENEYKQQLQFKEHIIKSLYAKKTRAACFSTASERDNWIHQQLKFISMNIKQKEEHLEQLRVNDQNVKKRIEKLTSTIKEKNVKLLEEDEQLNKCQESLAILNTKKENLDHNSRILWQTENNLREKAEALKEDIHRIDRILLRKINKPTVDAMKSVEKVLNIFAEEGNDLRHSYYELVIDNFECEDSLYVAVEVAGGNKLFQHVVATDQVATQLVKRINERKLSGSVTLMPLDKLQVSGVAYPESEDVRPLIKALKYDKKFEPVMRHIFGRYLLCVNQEVAMRQARQSGLNCVTIEGDHIKALGVLEGGYHDPTRSRIKIYNDCQSVKIEISDNEKDKIEAQRGLQDIKDEMNEVLSETQRMQINIDKSRSTIDAINQEIDLAITEKKQLTVETSEKDDIQRYMQSLEHLKNEKTSLETELNKDLRWVPSTQEEAEIEAHHTELKQLSRLYNERHDKRVQLESSKNKLDNFLLNNLFLKRNDLEQSLKQLLPAKCSVAVSTLEKEWENYKEEVDKHKKELDEIEAKIKQFSEKLKQHESELEDLKKRKDEELNMMENLFVKLGDIPARRRLIEEQIIEKQQKIIELEDEVDQFAYKNYSKKNIEMIHEALTKTKLKLKGLSYTGKRIPHEYMDGQTKRFADLLQRFSVIKESIDLLKEALFIVEQHRTDMVAFTFKQISNYFEKVFAQLVNGGKARLVFVKEKTASIRDADNQEVEETEEIQAEPLTFDNIVGVSVRVSFGDHEGEIERLKQLSGGQKSVISLALILAIQKTNPAPFYIFDEVDHALDRNHRKSLAELIQKAAVKTQFITTTFRPELLQHANQFYGVSYENMQSCIKIIQRDEAELYMEGGLN